MVISGIVKSQPKTAFGTISSSNPGNSYVAVFRGPVAGPDITIKIYDNATGDVIVTEMLRPSQVDGAIPHPVTFKCVGALAYSVHIHDGSTLSAPGVTIGISADQDAASLLASTLSLSPSGGSLQSSVPISAPSIAATSLALSGSGAAVGSFTAANLSLLGTARKPTDIMYTRMVKYALFGSSSADFDATKNVLAGTNGAFAEAPCGFMTAFQQSGADWDLVWNGGVDGYTSTQILAKIKSDWPTMGGYCDVVVIGSAFNDLADVNYNPTLTKANVAATVQWALLAGKSVVLVAPFMRNPSPTPYANYKDYESWCYSYAAANSVYPGQIMVASMLESLNPGGADTPAGLMAGGVHLNCAGAPVGVSGPSWTAVANAYGGRSTWRDATAYGQTIYSMDPTTSVTLANCTVAADTATADGRAQNLVTATANLGSVTSANLTVDTTKLHRIFVDYDIVAAPDGNQTYIDGAKLTASNNIRFGVYPNSGGGDDHYAHRVAGVRVRGFSRRFLPSSTGIPLVFYPGGANWQVRLRTCALLQIN